MTRGNQAGAVAVLTMALAAAWTAALAQYSNSDPRSPMYQEYQRQQQEQQQNKERADQQRRRSDELEDEEQQKQQQKNVERARESGAAMAKNHKLIEEARARLLRTAALAPDRNPLLGRWRVPAAESRAAKTICRS